MKSISQVFTDLNNQCALIPFITAGDPNLECTEQVLKILDQEGADIIELGLPYSDPLADGPIIQEASRKALSKGITLDKILSMVTKVTFSINAPLILFTYYNPILSRGIKKFLIDIAQAGIKGLIIPDLPVEEADYVIDLCKTVSLELILLITPTSSQSRVKSILSKSSQVVYVVSATGVTGFRDQINIEMKDFIKSIKAQTDKTIILGFGISTTNHVNQISQWEIDGIVIGSAFVKRLANNPQDNHFDNLTTFCSSLKKVLTDKC
uniref:Tryptophan synthase alpha chain n=1 Tax=Kumanoa americana TaxID=1196377 RepID=A0A1C9CGN3_9FLOR|nr:tryptophan synthase alpha subunit [Kumanoa americana]AOM67525.1 tryptophan synthase alpha subunit [Kumanoa americana]